MKRWVILVIAAAAAVSAAMPFSRTDVAELISMQALVVSLDQGQVVLDGGRCRGQGDTWEAAWQDLEQSADGVVFAGTAEHVILAGAAIRLLPEVAWSEELRPAAGICVSVGEHPDPEKAAAYLAAHETGTTLLRVREALLQGENAELPVLTETEGGFRLYGRKHR